MVARIALPGIVLFLLGVSLAVAAPALKAPPTAAIGASFEVTVSGHANPRDFVTIVAKSAAEGSYDYYQYAEKAGQVTLKAPTTPGDYEVRLLAAAGPYATLARQPMKITAVTATLEAPAQVAAGARIEIKWTGPNNPGDYIGLGDAKQPYLVYTYTRDGNPLSMLAPDVGGEYELRYFLGAGDKVIGARKVTVGKISASLDVPAQVSAGAQFAVKWTGPNNAGDFITIVKAGAPERSFETYGHTRAGNPLQLTAPDQSGAYEIRYLTGQTYATVVATKITVGAVMATVQGPAEAVAGSTFSVNWKGPNNPQDYITIVPKGVKEGTHAYYSYTAHGNPAKLVAPLQAGDYELWYATGQSHATLGKASVRITPAKQEPGKIVVTAANALGAGGGIEIILDASGSMLQKIGAQRRIDIAKQTLSKLTSTGIPAGTPFALRVFGREVDSCQTDLDIALSPLNAATVAAKINAWKQRTMRARPSARRSRKLQPIWPASKANAWWCW